MADTLKPLNEERCHRCGEMIDVQPGQTFTASTDGKVWHYGCSPSRNRSTALPVMADTELVEKVARVLNPDAWAIRDQDLQRRKEWDEGIKAGWGKTSFNTWANRFVGKSLKQARDALEAAGVASLIKRVEERDKEIADLKHDLERAMETTNVYVNQCHDLEEELKARSLLTGDGG